jgi:hypothetical protein
LFCVHFADALVDEWSKKEQLPPMHRQYVKNAMLRQHRHRHEHGRHDKKGGLHRTNSSEHIRQ